MITANSKNEFWFHVSNQNEIPPFGEVDLSLNIPDIVEFIENIPDEESQTEYVINKLKESDSYFDILRIFGGISKKRMYLELTFIFGKTKYSPMDDKNILNYPLFELKKHGIEYFKNLVLLEDFEGESPLLKRNGDPTRQEIKRQEKRKIKEKSREIVAEYLINSGSILSLKSLQSLDEDELSALVENLIAPKEKQQAETKRRGHGAEWELAKVLHQAGVEILPSDRHVNPMASDDPNVNKSTFQITPRVQGETHAFDIIINDSHNPKVFIQGLIHTSDPGQYGVDKSNDTIVIKEGMSNHNQQQNQSKELWGLVDGVGFIENPDNTIFKMITAFDTFIQLKTLYKALLKLHKLNIIQVRAIKFDSAFYEEQQATAMYEKYGSEDIEFCYDDSTPNGTEIKAGKAWVYL